MVRGSDFAQGEADLNIPGIGSGRLKIGNTIAHQLAFVDATLDTQGQNGKAH